jgi:hypothetical protein
MEFLNRDKKDDLTKIIRFIRLSGQNQSVPVNVGKVRLDEPLDGDFFRRMSYSSDRVGRWILGRSSRPIKSLHNMTILIVDRLQLMEGRVALAAVFAAFNATRSPSRNHARFEYACEISDDPRLRIKSH